MVIILYLLDRNVQTVKWNGQPLHEATKAEVEEVINVSYTLKVDYPITDTEIYKKFQEDMLIIAPTPVTGRQLFRIKEISEQDDTVSLTCQHITEDIFKRSVRPIKVSNSTCQIALNAMISAVKTPLGKFSFTSNIMDNRTFNTTEDETLYKILMDGKHSIVGAWEGEMIRDNFLIDIPKSRGIDRGVVITTHQNLKQYERNKSSSSIITRLHLKSTFKPEGAEEDTVLKVTVDSPLIGSYPYINEAEYENNDLTTEEELRKWGEAKFKNGDIDKSTDQIKVEAYELDGQTVHLGDTVTIMSLKHDVMMKKKAVGYVYDALSEEYISLTFDDKAGHGGGMSGSNGISDVASEILDTVQKTQEDDEYYKKLKILVDNANRAFEDKAGALKKEITDGIEQAKAQAEVVKEEISAQVTEKIKAANKANKNEIVEEFKAQYNGIEVKMEGFKNTTDQLKTSDADIKKIINDFKAQTQSQFVGVQGAQSRFEQTTEKAISDLTNVTNGKADRSFVEQTVARVKEEFTTIGVVGGPNMLRNSRADEGLKYWTEVNNRLAFTAHQFYFNGQKRMFELRPGAVVKSPRFIVKQNADYTLNFLGFDNNSKMFKVYFCKRRKGSTADFEEKQLVYDGKPRWTDGPILDGNRAIKKSFQFNVGNFDDGYLQFEYDKNNPNKWGGLFLTELDFYEGTNDRKWQPAPEDQNYLVEQAQATFEKTVEGLTTQLTQLESKAGPNGELEQRMQTYSEKAAVDALKATRQILEQGYIAKAKYDEDVAGINRRFESVATDTTPDNLIRFADTLTEYSVSNNNNNNNRLSRSEDGIFKMKIDGSPSTTWLGPCFPIYIDRILQGDVYSIAFDYMIKSSVEVDKGLAFALKNHSNNTAIFAQVFADKNTPKDRWIRAEFHFTANRDFEFNKTGNFPFYIYAINNGEFWVRNPILVRGSKIPAFRPSPLDKAGTSEAKIESKIAEYRQTVDGQFTTITNQIGDMLRKTDIQITPSQISFGTGKSINGRTISSLMVQEPESIALIAQLIKVKGDMVVDGSILGRHIASESVETGHMKAGSVTTPVLASNAVTADKLQVDYALIQKLLANQAFIRELMAQKAFITQLASIDISAEHVKGGRLSANTGSTVFDLDNGTLNLYSNTGTIRRIDDTNSSQFIKLTKSGFIAEQFRDSNAALMVIGTNHNKDPKEVERHDNETFAGIRLWSGKGNGKEESLTEFVGDRVLIYNNGRYRSPWNFHGNTNDGNAYLIPMNQNNVKHYIGRGDFFVEGIYSRHFYMSGGRDIGQYLWDLLTCFGIMKRYGQISGAAGNHVQGVLDKYGFR